MADLKFQFPHRWPELLRRFFPQPAEDQTVASTLSEENNRALEDFLSPRIPPPSDSGADGDVVTVSDGEYILSPGSGGGGTAQGFSTQESPGTVVVPADFFTTDSITFPAGTAGVKTQVTLQYVISTTGGGDFFASSQMIFPTATGPGDTPGVSSIDDSASQQAETTATETWRTLVEIAMITHDGTEDVEIAFQIFNSGSIDLEVRSYCITAISGLVN